MKIGFCWAGSSTYNRDFARSIDLAFWWPLFRLPGLEWVALITGERRAELDPLPPNVTMPDLGDWIQTLAIAQSCDLIITVDTALAHLAGSAHLPTWVLIPYPSDWRWLEDRTDSPWYPTVRLCRQEKNRGGDWWAVIEAVRQDLEAMLQRKAA